MAEQETQSTGGGILSTAWKAAKGAIVGSVISATVQGVINAVAGPAAAVPTETLTTGFDDATRASLAEFTSNVQEFSLASSGDVIQDFQNSDYLNSQLEALRANPAVMANEELRTALDRAGEIINARDSYNELAFQTDRTWSTDLSQAMDRIHSASAAAGITIGAGDDALIKARADAAQTAVAQETGAYHNDYLNNDVGNSVQDHIAEAKAEAMAKIQSEMDAGRLSEADGLAKQAQTSRYFEELQNNAHEGHAHTILKGNLELEQAQKTIAELPKQTTITTEAGKPQQTWASKVTENMGRATAIGAGAGAGVNVVLGSNGEQQENKWQKKVAQEQHGAHLGQAI